MRGPIPTPLARRIGYSQLSISAVEGLSAKRNAAGVWAVLGTQEDVDKSAKDGVPTTAAVVARAMNINAPGLYAENQSASDAAVVGTNTGGGTGVSGSSVSGEGVHAETRSTKAALAAYNLNATGDGFAVYAKKEGAAGFAGFFEGNVWVSGNISVGKDVLLTGADCAEDFDVSATEEVEPGAVMTLGEDGVLYPCRRAYDKRVAGVISGAGSYRAGIVLDKQSGGGYRKPLALVGKVYCKVSAEFGSVEIGDLLTTSPAAGHAMKAADPVQAFGSVIGKALRALHEGRGLIPILIALQ